MYSEKRKAVGELNIDMATDGQVIKFVKAVSLLKISFFQRDDCQIGRTKSSEEVRILYIFSEFTWAIIRHFLHTEIKIINIG